MKEEYAEFEHKALKVEFQLSIEQSFMMFLITNQERLIKSGLTRRTINKIIKVLQALLEQRDKEECERLATKININQNN